MTWLKWSVSRQQQAEACTRTAAMRQAYCQQGERIDVLAARTEQARTSAANQQGFDAVERALAQATGMYTHVGELLRRIEANLKTARGAACLSEVETALNQLTAAVDELEGLLVQWESQWQQVPLRIAEVEEALGRVRLQVEMAAAALGANLPTAEKLFAAEALLEQIRRTLAEGDPFKAGSLAADLRITLGKLAEETNLSLNGIQGLIQAEQELAQLRGQIAGAGAPSAAAHALSEADALLPRLRPALITGRMDQFQQDLLTMQRCLFIARSALRP